MTEPTAADVAAAQRVADLWMGGALPGRDKSELVRAIARALAEERERCAKIADLQESPWSAAHPEEAYIGKLASVVETALLNSNNSDPELAVAHAVFAFLQTGQKLVDRLFGTQTIAARIRALGREDG